jgi:tetratricopeptide (TPR) repeat protein
MRALVRRHGHPDARMLLTVSPVPFKATFTGEDALAANCYSKSVQRAACEAFARAHDDVDYFASYEAVTLSDRSLAFEEDNIHVRRELVGQIMRDVIKAYAPSLDIGEDIALPTAPPRKRLPKPTTLLSRATEQSAQGEHLEAIVTMGALLHRHGESASPDELANWRARYANLCLLAGDRAEATRYALQVPEDSGDAAAFYLAGITLSRLGLEDEAKTMLHRATTLAPQHAEYAWRYGQAHFSGGDLIAAAQYFERALTLDPEHKQARTSLSRILRKRA